MLAAMRGGARGLLILLVIAIGLRAEAQDKQAAQTAYRRAAQHYNLNEFQEALDSFKEAYRAVEDPALLFNIGQCLRRLDRPAEALAAFQSYIRNLPNASNRAEVERVVEKLIEQIEKERIQREKAEREAQRQREAEAASVTAPAPPPPAKTPLVRKWWLWTAVGGVVLVGVGLGVGLALGLPPNDRFVKSTNTTDPGFRF